MASCYVQAGCFCSKLDTVNFPALGNELFAEHLYKVRISSVRDQALSYSVAEAAERIPFVFHLNYIFISLYGLSDVL